MTDLSAESILIKDIDTALEERHRSEEEAREYLGASSVGHECRRSIWLLFRWFGEQDKDGRTVRILRRGHNEERTILSDLFAANLVVRHCDKDQKRIEIAPHIAGHPDGIITSGLSGYEGDILLEMKTHKSEMFRELLKEGVRGAFPQYYAQMQVYMHAEKLKHGLYVGVNKNDDTYYIEIIDYCERDALRYIKRGYSTVMDSRLPEPISDDPSFLTCKAKCSFHSFCHGQVKALPQINCRTCAHSTALDTGEWRCERIAKDGIPLWRQRTGCKNHAIHTELVEWTLDDELSTELEPAFIIDDKVVINGADSPEKFSSQELVANPSACANASSDDITMGLRKDMGAKIVG